MSDQKSSIWDGFESEFFENQGGMSLSETQPASHVTSSIAEHRQILNILFIVDVSGSMRGKRIAQVNYAMENIVKELRNRDDINSSIRRLCRCRLRTMFLHNLTQILVSQTMEKPLKL